MREVAVNGKMRSIQKVTACVLALIVAIARVEIISASEIPINFSLIVSYGRFGYNSSPGIPAIDLALEHIHSSGILGEYKLQYSTVQDSECNRGKSLDAFFDDFLLQPDSVKIALIGCGCSVATEPVAEISHKWNISQISFASAVSTLSDRTRFKNFFRTYPNFGNFVPALLSVLNHYNWSRIVFLTQDENLFNKLFAGFQTLLKILEANPSNTNITVVNKRFTTNEGPIPTTNDVFEDDEDYRIFFVNSYSGMARSIICEAAKRNLTYPHYVWITYGWYPDGWWTKAVSKNDISCSDPQLEDFIVKTKMLQIQQYPTPNDFDGSTIFGITPRQFDELYENRSTQLGYTPTLVRGIAYDAVWALALGLNRTQEMFLSNYNVSEIGCDGLDGGLVSLEQFNYSNGVMGCVMRWSLEQTDFSGVSGRVRFDVNGTVFQDRIRLLQYRRHSNRIELLRFGYVDRTANSVLTYEENEADVTVFPDGVPPDGTPQQVIHTFQLGLVVVFYFLAAVGIIFSVICILFNFVFRNRSVVRMSSPNLNYLIIAGSLLMYFSVYVQLLYSTNETANHVRCILHTWIYVLGYLLAFGTILAKMWRVYQIFHNPTPNKMAPKDWHLVLIVVLIVGIVIPLVVGKSVSQRRPPMLLQDNENREGRMALGVRQENYVWVCYQPGSPPFYCDLFLFLYLGVLQIVGLILAFQTRKVKIPILNDSKFVAALVYISSVVFVALALVTFLLREYINISSGIFSAGIMLLATIFLILMFVPKMLNLYSDPEGKRIFEKSNPATAHHPTTSAGAPTQNGSDGEKTIGDAEEVLKQKERRISELERELTLIKNGRLNTQE